MRGAILTVGLMAGLLCAAMGWIQKVELNRFETEDRIIRDIEWYRITSPNAKRPMDNGKELTPSEEGRRYVERLQFSATLLLVNFPLAVLAGVLGYFRRRVLAGVLFLVAAAAPILAPSVTATVVTENLMWMVCAVSPLLLSSLLVCFLQVLPQEQMSEETVSTVDEPEPELVEGLNPEPLQEKLEPPGAETQRESP
jgi:hypothetical protein